MTHENDAFTALVLALIRYRLANWVRGTDDETEMEAELALAWACVREAERD